MLAAREFASSNGPDWQNDLPSNPRVILHKTSEAGYDRRTMENDFHLWWGKVFLNLFSFVLGYTSRRKSISLFIAISKLFRSHSNFPHHLSNFVKMKLW